MKWTVNEVDAELERLKVPSIVSLGGLARATGIDARTLANKCRNGELGETVKGPRKGLYVLRRRAAEYFAGTGERIWTAAFSRRLPETEITNRVAQPEEEEKWRQPHARNFPRDQRSQVRLLEASNWGNVRTVVDRRASPAGSVLKPRTGAGGYEYVYVTLPPTVQERRRARREGRKPDYRGKNLAVHRLVASAWCDRKRRATEVHHLDGKRANNTVRSLCWVTRKENAQHARLNGGVGRSWGRPGALDPEDVADILTKQLSAKKYSEKYDVGERQIYRIWSGKQWKRMQPKK